MEPERQPPRRAADLRIEDVERNVDEERWKREMYAKAGRGGTPVSDV